jgi:hypothetical protein
MPTKTPVQLAQCLPGLKRPEHGPEDPPTFSAERKEKFFTWQFIGQNSILLSEVPEVKIMKGAIKSYEI